MLEKCKKIAKKCWKNAKIMYNNEQNRRKYAI